MIDDLLGFDGLDGNDDDLDARLAALSRQSSQVRDTVSSDRPSVMVKNDEELKRLKE
jgi:ABC-type transporter Mla subunit MlaD